MKTIIIYKAALVSIISLCIGCENNSSPNQAWNEYKQELSDILDTPVTEKEPSQMPSLSFARYSRPSTAQRISLIELWELQHCQLAQSISARNSNLGRVGAASQQLLFDIEYLKFTPACIETLNDNVELKSQLNRVFQEKLIQLPSVIVQTIVSSEEWYRYWRKPIESVPVNIEDGVEAIEELAVLLSSWNTHQFNTSPSLEGLLGRLYQSNAGGWLIMHSELFTQEIQSATVMLESTTRFDTCLGANIRQRSRRLNGLISSRFINDIQRTEGNYLQLNMRMTKAANMIEGISPGTLNSNYRPWRDARNTIQSNVLASIQNHVEALNRLLSVCNVNPKRT